MRGQNRFVTWEEKRILSYLLFITYSKNVPYVIIRVPMSRWVAELLCYRSP